MPAALHASWPDGRPIRDPRRSVISGKGNGRVLPNTGNTFAGRSNISFAINVSMFSAKFALAPHVRVNRSQSTTLVAGNGGGAGSLGGVVRIRSSKPTWP